MTDYECLSFIFKTFMSRNQNVIIIVDGSRFDLKMKETDVESIEGFMSLGAEMSIVIQMYPYSKYYIDVVGRIIVDCTIRSRYVEIDRGFHLALYSLYDDLVNIDNNPETLLSDEIRSYIMDERNPIYDKIRVLANFYQVTVICKNGIRYDYADLFDYMNVDLSEIDKFYVNVSEYYTKYKEYSYKIAIGDMRPDDPEALRVLNKMTFSMYYCLNDDEYVIFMGNQIYHDGGEYKYVDIVQGKPVLKTESLIYHHFWSIAQSIYLKSFILGSFRL